MRLSLACPAPAPSRAARGNPAEDKHPDDHHTTSTGREDLERGEWRREEEVGGGGRKWIRGEEGEAGGEEDCMKGRQEDGVGELKEAKLGWRGVIKKSKFYSVQHSRRYLFSLYLCVCV